MGSRQSRYFFDLDGPDEDDNYIDCDGTRLPNDEIASDHAERVIRELKKTGAYNDLAWHVVVKDENGDIAFRIPFRGAHRPGIVTAVASMLPFIRPRSDFKDEVTRAMGEAFDAACKELHDGHPDDVRNVIAKRIVEAARLGERDVVRLRDAALATIGRRPGAMRWTDRQEMIFPFTTRGRPTPSATAFGGKAAPPVIRSRVRL
jgi:hypothetical protein